MSYIVLARKYRPGTFKEIYSQDHITQVLSNAIKMNRIAHAYLFTGPRGVGKTSMARILAKSLNCQNGPTEEPCGICNNCLEITSTSSPDVIEIDGASNTGVDDVRELQKELFYVPNQSKFKIYIIDEVHMLSKNAFNALLKTLEEPPENVVFIFATTEPQKVLPTIISRCQRFDFRRIPIEDITARLKEISIIENIDIDEESLYLIARKSDGGMRDALSLLDQVLSFADGPIRVNLVQEVLSELPLITFAEITEAILNHDPIKLMQLYQEVINQGIDLAEFLNSYIEFMRHLLMLKVGIQLKGIVSEDLQLLTKLVDASNLNNLMYMMSLLIQLKQDIRISSHSSIMIEVVLLKMSRLDEMDDLDKILARITNLPSMPVKSNEQAQQPAQQVPIKKSEPIIPPKDESFELDYVPPKKVLALTLEHVLENWDAFIDRIKSTKKMLAIYLTKERIKNVKSDIIFLEFDSTMQYKMVNEAKSSLTDMLSKFFGIPVNLIITLKETAKVDTKRNPTLQDIKAVNPKLAALIELTDSMISSE